jgi:ABC-2 type transport system permease protein
MLHQIYAITVKNVKTLLRDRGGMVSLFAMPIMFILVMSVALQSSYQVGGSDRPIEILAVNQDQGALAGEAIADLNSLEGITILEEIDADTLTRARAEELIMEGTYRVALVFPEDFSRKILDAVSQTEAPQAQVTFIADPTTSSQFLSPIQGTVQGFIERTAAYAQTPLQIQAGFAEIAQSVPAQQQGFLDRVAAQFLEGFSGGQDEEASYQSPVTFERVAPASFAVEEFPDSVEQNVPGYTIFGVFFIVQVLAGSLLQEKQEGTFRRLLVAPLSQSALLLGQLLPYYLINIIQVALMFAVGNLVFGMSLGSSPLALLLVTMALAAAATGLGLLVAALGKTPKQVNGISTLLALTLAAVGGMMVPTFVMPEFMQLLARISPHHWALIGYQDVIVRGLGVEAILLEISVLMGFAVVFFGFAVWRFRFE